MQKKITIMALFLLPLWLAAQRYTISGYVNDKENGEKLIGANVYNAETYQGGVTNAYGFYSVSFPAGKVKLVYSFVGYNSKVIELDLQKNLTLNVELGSSIELAEVVVTGEKSGMNLQSTQMSTIDIPMKTITSLPSFMGEPDIIKGIQLLPGVQSGSEGMSGLYVRGGGPDQNLILLDGVPVYNVNHLFGFFSVFNPDAIQNAKLVKGGFPARYGGRLSSVLDISMKEGNTKEFKGSASVGIIASKLTLEGPIGEKASFIISGRRTYIDVLMWPFIKMAQAQSGLDEMRAGYYFYDLNGKVNYRFSDKSRLYLSVYMGKDRFYAYQKDENSYSFYNSEQSKYVEAKYNSQEDVEFWWGNITSALRWNYQFNDKLFSNTTLTYSRFKMLTGFEMYYKNQTEGEPVTENQGSYNYNSGINDIGYKLDFDYYPNNNHMIKFGVSNTYHTFNPGVNIIEQDGIGIPKFSQKIGNDEVYTNELETYIEDDIRIGALLKMNLGIHGTGYFIKGKQFYSIQPRVAARYEITDKLSMKASWANMDQYINLLTNSNIGLPTDLWVPATKNNVPMKAWQAGWGTMYELPKDFEISLEAYYKRLNNLSGMKDGANFMSINNSWENKLDKGTGWSYGVELLLMRNIGKTTGWIGYTWSKTENQFPTQIYSDVYPYKYDRRHDISIVVTHKFSDKMDMGLTWVFGSGYPITLGTMEYPTMESLESNATNNYTESNDYQYESKITEITSKNNFRMPPYHRLDISLNMHKQLRWAKRTFSFAVYNAYNRKNPFFVMWDYPEDYSGMMNGMVNKKLYQYSIFPIMPSISLKFDF